MASVHSDGGASLMAHRSFVAFWLARTCSGFGFQMLSIVVGWQIYALTHSAFYLGLIGLVQFLPSITLALWAGHIADQRDRRRVVLIGQLVEWLAIVALAAATLAHLADVKIILGLIFIISVAKVMEAPSLQSMLPALVPPSLLARATAASAVSSQAAMIMGPALGGLLYVFGAQVVYALTAVLYLISVVMVSRLRYEQAPPARQPASLATLFAGVKFIRERPDVLGVISLDLFAVLLGGATALLPIYAHDILHTGPWGLGLLRAAPAVGALLVGFWLSRRSLEKHVGMIMFLSVAGFGVATLVFALSSNLWLSLIALFATGGFDMVSMVIRGALVQLDTPNEMLGRVNAVNSIFINTSNQLGEFESGMLAALLGTVPAAAIGGIGTLVVVGLWMRLFPSLRKRQRLEETPA
ncbi:TPA: MFS transporter [Cronobacter sakazakii]|uniref:MFS transporter n=1 Tax=Cronobacter sakazakii TaxID=28141 RepID=UPI0004A8F4A2|nr:MFS transporter [Cronobacter sakazakii]EGT5207205.1 MFS transporter [Cronobacter sakazakii]EGT5753419.1 MFS transporter [Cronobacter sakazakii]EIZ2182442.1 MFS transporter [Cronobacter sakazakii]EIZ2226044.1 MFS transporter [Cronobacter sakazakii]EIZ2229755.1 MFS transporter [Cronobacter sakazakii]